MLEDLISQNLNDDDEYEPAFSVIDQLDVSAEATDLPFLKLAGSEPETRKSFLTGQSNWLIAPNQD